MPGRTPAEAIQQHRIPLQRAISCVSDAVLLGILDPRPGVVQGFFLSDNPAPVRGGPVIWLQIELQYRTIAPDLRGRGWEAERASYAYRGLGAEQGEVFAYHWHPESRSRVTAPHLHIGSGMNIPKAVSAAHFPTGPVMLHEVVRLLISDFGVRPRRADWARILG